MVNLSRRRLRRAKPDALILADQARDARQWELAAQLYRKALDRDPGDPPVWVQYGHALKESGELRDPDKLAQAELAYRRALSLDPGVADTHLQLGHVLKLQGKPQEAEASYLRAFALDPSVSYPLYELVEFGWSEPLIAELEGLVAFDAASSEATISATSPVTISQRPIKPLPGKSDGANADYLADDIRIIRESGLFDETYYRANNPDLPADIHLVRHFIEVGSREGRLPNRLFDPTYYLSHNPDVAESGHNPLVHFIRQGAAEGRRPHRYFDPAFYLAKYPDVAASGKSALWHYLSYGQKAGRTPANLTYEDWSDLYDNVSDRDRTQIASRMAQLRYQPMVSVVLRADSSSTANIRYTVESVQRQLYPVWELWIVPDASMEEPVLNGLWQLTQDQRVKLSDRSICADWSAILNDVLNTATGEFIAFMDDDGELSEIALYMFVEEINQHPDADIVYTDEDWRDMTGRRYEPHFKSDWNPDLFYSGDYVGNLKVCRTSLVKGVGGVRPGFYGAERYDLLLRMIEQTTANRIRHIPFILYHRKADQTPTARSRSPMTPAANAARHALSDHFSRIGQTAIEVAPGPSSEFHRIIRPVPRPQPLVSLIIPTGGKDNLLKNCLSGLLWCTDYDNIEVIILYNTSTKQEIFPYLEEISADPRVTIIDSRGGFNFSRICNLGVQRARGEIIGLINDDIEVIEPGWLREMVGHALRPEVGAVGARLYYPNDTLQHAGVILGIGGLAGHIHRHLPREAPGYFHRAVLTQDLSCVTAACQVLRREVYLEVGGYDEAIAVSFNDVDFCLKLRRKGYLVVWTPAAELYHLELMTRPSDSAADEQPRFGKEWEYVRQKWGLQQLQNDPYFNPNCRLDVEAYEISAPPRVAKPWLTATG